LEGANEKLRQPTLAGRLRIAKIYLDSCLEGATKTAEFCDGVPNSRSTEASDAWRAQQFKQLRPNINDLVIFRNNDDEYIFRDSYYHAFLSVIQDHCAQRRAKE
jgi:hypothetical protein